MRCEPGNLFFTFWVVNINVFMHTIEVTSKDDRLILLFKIQNIFEKIDVPFFHSIIKSFEAFACVNSVAGY